MAFEVTQLNVYPIKSLAGIALSSATLSQTGIEYDRNWMLVDGSKQMLTQREIPELALFKTQLLANELEVQYRGNAIRIPYQYQGTGEEIGTEIFGTNIQALQEEERINQWFSEQLGRTINLLRAAEHQPRFVKRHQDARVNFPDGHQYLVIGEASLELLNSKLEEPLPINRFRPNIVFKGGSAHVEDEWTAIRIGNVNFAATKSCGRCQITGVNQDTAEVSKEPLRTLAGYRSSENKVLFGRYLKLIDAGEQTIAVGDIIQP